MLERDGARRDGRRNGPEDRVCARDDEAGAHEREIAGGKRRTELSYAEHPDHRQKQRAEAEPRRRHHERNRQQAHRPRIRRDKNAARRFIHAKIGRDVNKQANGHEFRRVEYERRCRDRDNRRPFASRYFPSIRCHAFASLLLYAGPLSTFGNRLQHSTAQPAALHSAF